MKFLLSLSGVSKSFGSKMIFYNVTSSFEKGCYAITGSNGVGKTILIEMLAGVLRQDAGSIFLKDVGYSISEEYKKNLTYIPGKPLFFPQATGEEFLSFIYSIKKNKKNISCMHDFLDRLKLSMHLKTKFNNMSLGTQKKLFLVTLAMNNSKLVVMDEPSNALDDDSNEGLSDLIKQLANDAIVILATHDQKLLSKINPTIIKLMSIPTTELKFDKYEGQHAAKIL